MMRFWLLKLLGLADNPTLTLSLLPLIERWFSADDALLLASHREWHARWLATRHLGTLAARSPAAQEALWQLADDPHRLVREGVARALATWLNDHPSAVEVFLARLRNDQVSPYIQQVALLTVIALLHLPTPPPAVIERLCQELPKLLNTSRHKRLWAKLSTLLEHRFPQWVPILQATSPSQEPSQETPHMWRTTAEIPIPAQRIDQVIGQPHAVAVAKIAARQRRFLLLIGEPGTGKSLIAEAMAELLVPDRLEDILVYPNPEQPISPRIRTFPAGHGPAIVARARRQAMARERAHRILLLLGIAAVLLTAAAGWFTGVWWPTILAGVLTLVLYRHTRTWTRVDAHVPRLLVRHVPGRAPFVDATGFQAGALLGDVRHDPFQSGGRETPPHHLVEAGAIHQAHGGVLFIDEVSTLSPESQQNLLTAIQTKRMPISGRSPGSSGSMVRTEPVPCDVVLVLAGNEEDVAHMHPGLRSRVRGYGYEVLMATEMPDTPENRAALARFVAQEVAKDGRIPHFTRAAVEAIIEEARRRASPGHLTLRLRELGGLVRAAGDVAVSEGASLVEPKHVHIARQLAMSLEDQKRRREAKPKDV